MQLIFRGSIAAFVLLVLVQMSSSAQPSHSLNGLLTDAQSGKPLAGANIYIHELKQWTTTNEAGQYLMTGLPAGVFTIEASFIGYHTFSDSVLLAPDAVKNMQLSRAITEAGRVVVTGVASATPLKYVPTHISVLTQKDLEEASGAHLLDAISRLPGVQLVTTGPAIAKPFIRGLGFDRVITLHDGVRQEGQQWGAEHGLEMDEFSTRKIELLRGPASLMYGSDAIGGVVNIFTQESVSQHSIRANLTSSFHSNNHLWARHARVSGNKNGLIWSAYGSLKNAGDYKNAVDGKVLNSRFAEKNFGASAGINKKWGFSHFQWSRFFQHPGMIEGTRDNAGNFVLEGDDLSTVLRNSKKPLEPNQQVLHSSFSLDNMILLKNGAKLTALAAYQQNSRKEFGHHHLHHNDEEHDAEEHAGHEHGADVHFLLKTINYNAAFHFPALQQWKSSIGISGMSQYNRNKGNEVVIPDYNLQDWGAFFYTTRRFAQTSVSGGLRYDWRHIAMLSSQSATNALLPGRSFSNISASIGVAGSLSKNIMLKANVSRGFRAPNASELAANGAHEGTGRYERGNARLKSEISLSVDGGLQLSTPHVDMNLAVFHNHIQNYIYQRRLLSAAGTDSLTNQMATFQFDQQTAKLAGLEAGLDIHPHPLDWLHVENTFSFVRGRFMNPVDGDTYNLPLIAPARWLMALRGEFPGGIGVFKNIYLKIEMDNYAAQNKYFAAYRTETATPGYTLFNTGLGSDIVTKKRTVATLVFAVSNLTDVSYQNHLSRLKYLPQNSANGKTGVYNIGRNVMIKAIIPMEWKW